jgi:hypothetical protein
MSNRGSVGSLIESHRAKAMCPDRRNFLPQTGQLPSAALFSRRLPQSGQSDAKKATGVKATDAATLYENILTIQNAADLQWPATDPANAGVRGEFLLGIFPPDHGGNHTPPPTPPAPQTPGK